jgi:hypothetical protein
MENNNINKVSSSQIEAKKYIEENDLEKIISEMMNSIVYEKPKQPLLYMIKYLCGLLNEEERKMYNLIIPEPYPKGRPIVKFPNLENINNPLKRILTKNLWPNIKYKKTKFGGTINNLMKISENKITEKNGILLCDGDSINTFDQLVMPIINSVNLIEDKNLIDFISSKVLTNSSHFPYNDKINENVKVLRISYSRNLQDFGFCNIINEKNRENVENLTTKAIYNLINEKVLPEGKFINLKDNEKEGMDYLKGTLHDFEEFESVLNHGEMKRGN